MQHERWTALPVFIVVFGLYLLGGTIAWATINASGLGAVFFPPAGLTLSALLLTQRSRWPAIALAVMAGEWVTGVTAGGSDHHLSLIGFGIANIVGPLTGAVLIGALLDRAPGTTRVPDIGRRFDAAVVAVAGVGAGTLVSALIGAATASVAFGSSITTLAPQWWLGDALGVVVVAPLALAWFATPSPGSWRSIPALLLVALAGAATTTALGVSNIPVLFLPLTIMVFAGMLYDVRTVALCGAAISVAVGVMLAVEPGGLIESLHPSTALTVTKLEFLVFALTAYGVSAESNERTLAAETSATQLDTVGELQRLLLPPTTMVGHSFSAEGRYDAAAQRVGVGGDWYLVKPTLDGRLVFGVGDIVGHDIDAARSVASVRSGLVLEAALDPSPTRLLERLDAFSHAEPSIRYSSAWIGVFDPATRLLEYACAGHLPPLVVSDGDVSLLDTPSDSLVGLPLDGRALHQITLPANAAVVLYTDGLIERRGQHLDHGIARLVGVVEQRGCHADAVFQTMLADSPRDDDTILAMIQFGASTPHGESVVSLDGFGAADSTTAA